MCVVIKSRPEFKMGHVGSKTRSLGQFLEKPCVLSRRHSFDPVFMKLCQNDFLTLNKCLSRRAMLSDDSSCFVVAVNCFNNYKRIRFTKYRYCLLVYKNPFLEILSFTGGGGGGGGEHISAGLPYPPLPLIPHHHPGHCSSEFLQIIK